MQVIISLILKKPAIYLLNEASVGHLNSFFVLTG